ncbi:hypothetical protein PUNSTDRAFT_50887, partial [Punctularia strigosozonata HHB-11173 SS5]|uniref:uncharacterized protein n=1 Tax=Punctularia strigosozonata (strain HHB-11173) TaxID=741275 RepID=UPI00044163CF
MRTRPRRRFGITLPKLLSAVDDVLAVGTRTCAFLPLLRWRCKHRSGSEYHRSHSLLRSQYPLDPTWLYPHITNDLFRPSPERANAIVLRIHPGFGD